MSSNSTTTDGNSSSSSIILPETKLWVHTKSATFKIEFNWSIDNFSFYLEDNPTKFSPIVSHRYSAPGQEEIRLVLCLYPNSETNKNKNYLSLYLFCNSAHFPSPVYVKYKMSFVDSEGKDQYLRDFQYKFTKCEGNGAAKMIARSALLDPANGLLPKDQLTIHCEASICFILEDQFNHIVGTDSDGYSKQFSLDMASLLEDAKHSDVTLTVGGTEFCAHKNILSVRSPVFDAMFNHEDTKEACEGKVEIDDVPVDVFQDLLQFIYTGTVPAKERLTNELLAASDKYQVEGLKSACESHLSTSLSVESAATTLLFADMYNATSLKVTCLQYISGNIFAVISTTAWLNMVKTRPELMLEIGKLSSKKTVFQEEEKEEFM